MISLIIALAVSTCDAKLPDSMSPEEMDVAVQTWHTCLADNYASIVHDCDAQLALFAGEGRTEAFHEVKAVCDVRERTALQRQTGALIANGKCGDALSVSLAAGALDLAKDIKSLCTKAK